MHGLSSFVLLMASLLVVRGAGLGKSSEHAVHDVTGSDGDIHPFLRVARSSTANMPCVTVPYLTELKGRFTRWFDHNDNGKAEFDEVRDYLRRFKPNISPNAVAAFIRRRDADGNGMIDFIPEYVEDLTTPDFTLEAANEWFQLQDTNDDGYVSEGELVQGARAVGMSPEVALDSVRGYYMVADLDKDKKLSFDEFKSLYNQ